MGSQPVVVFEAEALVLVDEQVALAVTAARFENVPQARRRVLPRAGRDPPDLDLLHLEQLSWCRQLRVDLRDGRLAHMPSPGCRDERTILIGATALSPRSGRSPARMGHRRA